MIPSLLESYDFYVGSDQVYPANDTIQWSYEPEDALGFFRKKMTTKLFFRNDVQGNTYSFDVIRANELNNRCISEDFIINHKCGAPIEAYRGRIKAMLCTFDLDHCEVEVEVEFRDELSCLLDDKPQVPFIGDSPILTTIGNFEFIACSRVATDNILPIDAYQNEDIIQYFLNTYPPEADCLPAEQPFTLFEYGVRWNAVGWLFGDSRVYLTSFYGRIRRDTEPDPLDGWTELVDVNTSDPFWVRPLDLAEYTLFDGGSENLRNFYYNDGSTGEVELLRTADRYAGKRWRVYDIPYMQYYIKPYPKNTEPASVYTYGSVFGTYTNLGNTINNCFDFCDTIYYRSNFFNWNTYGTQPYNEAYALMDELLALGELRCYNLADVAYVYPTYSLGGFTPSTYQTMDAVIFLQSLKEMFNLGFDYDPITNYVTIEHISYFEKERRIDLTALQLVEYIKGFHKYEYDNSKSPLIEKYRMAMDSSRSFEMDILYSGDCISPDRQTENHTSANIYTDLRYISDIRCDGQSYFADVVIRSSDSEFINPRIFPPTAKLQEDNQFKRPAINTVFLALVDTDNLFVWSEEYPRPNELLSYRALEVLHYWKRPQLSGTINEDELPTDFLTQRRLKKQVELTFPICCEDVDNFKAKILVKSQMGWGEIEKATIDDPPREMTLTLLHDVDGGSTYNPTT